MTSMDNTPDSPAKTPEGYTTQGGNFWTLITPETWKVLHAVLHIRCDEPDFTVAVDGAHWQVVEVEGLVRGVAGSGTHREKILTSHDGLLTFVQFRPLFREAAGYLNTVSGPPADFPRRVLYSCALPGHRPLLSRITGQRKTYGREKAALTFGSGFRLTRCVQHLT